MASPDDVPTARWRWLALGAAALLLGVWMVFFDSYSVKKRLRFQRQRVALSTENDSLRLRLQTLQNKLDRPLADSTVERIAREQYGMHRPGETVYQVER